MFQLSNPLPSKCQHVSILAYTPTPFQSISSGSIVAQTPPKHADVILERSLTGTDRQAGKRTDGQAILCIDFWGHSQNSIFDFWGRPQNSILYFWGRPQNSIFYFWGRPQSELRMTITTWPTLIYFTFLIKASSESKGTWQLKDKTLTVPYQKEILGMRSHQIVFFKIGCYLQIFIFSCSCLQISD